MSPLQQATLLSLGPAGIGNEHVGYGFSVAVNVDWPSANLAIGVPLYLEEDFAFTRHLWISGSIVGRNLDVGIYDETGHRVASTGSTVTADSSNEQSVAVSGTLSRGIYYLAASSDSSVARIQRATAANVGIARATGAVQAASSFPLPSSITWATLTNNFLPVLGVTLLATS